MSYARFGKDSDVYVYESDYGWECCGCALETSFTAESPQEMIDHLKEHQVEGHKVPQYALDRLKDEAEESDPLIKIPVENSIIAKVVGIHVALDDLRKSQCFMTAKAEGISFPKWMELVKDIGFKKMGITTEKEQDSDNVDEAHLKKTKE